MKDKESALCGCNYTYRYYDLIHLHLLSLFLFYLLPSLPSSTAILPQPSSVLPSPSLEKRNPRPWNDVEGDLHPAFDEEERMIMSTPNLGPIGMLYIQYIHVHIICSSSVRCTYITSYYVCSLAKVFCNPWTV